MTTVYETMRVRHGTIPLLGRHLARLAANARAAGLAQPPDLEAKVRAAVPESADRAMRLEWDGSALEVAVRPLRSRQPMVVVTSSVPHPGYRVKTTDREAFEQARQEAERLGADEALLLTPGGFVAEGTLFAVLWFHEDRLCAPSLDLGILPSIGRERVLEVATEMGYAVAEGRYPRSALDGRAAFAVTATRGVFGIAVLDGVPVPGDPRIAGLAARFWPDADPGPR